MGDPSVLGGAFLDLMTKMMSDPAAVAAAQIDLFNDSMTLWRHAAERMLNIQSEDAALPRDKRFSHPEWSENATFSFIRESYLVASKSLLATVRGVKDLDPQTARKVDFYTRQFVDAMSPSNFIATNPEVLSATLNTGGENLLRGLEHVLADLDHGEGRLQIAMTDPNAFRLGENIAATPCKVVYQNELLQLLQYEPSTPKVRKRPLFIIMPWINKFYVLDLQPKNSFIKWAVDQGHTVFVPSWVNPDERLAQTTFEDYMTHGLIAAFDAIEAATGEHQLQCDRLLPRRHHAQRDDRLSDRAWRRPHRQRHQFRHAGRFHRRRRHGGVRRRAADLLGREAHARAWLSRRGRHGDVVQHAARQRSHLVVRGQQLPARQGPGRRSIFCTGTPTRPGCRR